MPSVVKHSYVKGRSMAAKMAAHINYLQYRGDEHSKERKAERGVGELPESAEDRKRRRNESRIDPDTGEAVKGKARPMWDQDGKRIFGSEFKRAIKQDLKSFDVAHKLIISPGINSVDMHQYTREIMGQLAKDKGQDLRYAYVVHGNTEHVHAHVVLLGRDREGRTVRIDKFDHTRIRNYGDRYLERNHQVERIFDKEMERFARHGGVNLYLPGGSSELHKLLGKKPSREKQRELEDILKHDENWKALFAEPSFEGNTYMGKSSYHEIGRQADFRELGANAREREMWEDILKNHPDRQEQAQERLGELARQRGELLQGLREKTEAHNPERFLDNIASDFAAESRQLQAVLKGHRDWERSDIDYDSVPAADKLTLSNEQCITRYDSSEELKQINERILNGQLGRLGREDFGKLQKWIGDKERRGEDCYGVPPLIELPIADGREEPEPALDLETLPGGVREFEWERVIDGEQIRQLLENQFERDPLAEDAKPIDAQGEHGRDDARKEAALVASAAGLVSGSEKGAEGKLESDAVLDESASTDYEPDWQGLESDEAGSFQMEQDLTDRGLLEGSTTGANVLEGMMGDSHTEPDRSDRDRDDS